MLCESTAHANPTAKNHVPNFKDIISICHRRCPSRITTCNGFHTASHRVTEHNFEPIWLKERGCLCTPQLYALSDSYLEANATLMITVSYTPAQPAHHAASVVLRICCRRIELQPTTNDLLHRTQEVFLACHLSSCTNSKHACLSCN